MNIEEIRELGKKEINYNRHVAYFGAEAANTVLVHWVMGFQKSQKLKQNQISLINLEKPVVEKKDVAITTLQLLANAAGATFEDEKMAVDIIEETLLKSIDLNLLEKLKESVLSITNKYGTPGNNQKKNVWAAFYKLEKSIVS